MEGKFLKLSMSKHVFIFNTLIWLIIYLGMKIFLGNTLFYFIKLNMKSTLLKIFRLKMNSLKCKT